MCLFLCGCVYVCWFWCHNAHIMLSKGKYPLWLDRQMQEMSTEMGMELGLMDPGVSGLMRSTNLSSFVIGWTANWNESRSKVCSTLPFHSFLLVTFITPLLLFIWSCRPSSSWLNLSNRRCIDSVWHIWPKICDKCKHSYPRLNSVWQNLSSQWSRYFHSPPSLSASLHLSLSVSTSILLWHRSLAHPTFQGKRVYFNSMPKVEKRRNASSTTTPWMALYWMRRPTHVSLSRGKTTSLKR